MAYPLVLSMELGGQAAPWRGELMITRVFFTDIGPKDQKSGFIVDILQVDGWKKDPQQGTHIFMKSGIELFSTIEHGDFCALMERALTERYDIEFKESIT